jgi:hypothetical protein
MTLRPPKHSDKMQIEAAMQKKRKEVELTNKLPPYTLVICEGVKTEVNYIQGLINLINARYSEINREYSHLFPKDRIRVFGTGRNTESLLKFTRDYAKKPENKHYTRIWIMYDKDDFPNDNFDNTQFSINDYNDQDRQFFAAWSNECLELWFILYFQDLTVNVSREQYQVILKRYFDYEKNLSNLFEILDNKGDINQAILRAKKLRVENKHKNSPSQMAPVTLVYELVEELREYLTK